MFKNLRPSALLRLKFQPFGQAIACFCGQRFKSSLPVQFVNLPPPPFCGLISPAHEF
jgi:hypothetical protein